MVGFDWARLAAMRAADAIRVLAVKEAYHEASFADAAIGIDLVWLKQERQALARLAQAMQVVLALRPTRLDDFYVPGATYHLRKTTNHMLLDDDQIDATHSGQAAIHYAVLRGATQISLFGFDYSSGHYCPERYARRVPSRYISTWARGFGDFAQRAEAAGIAILNGCPHSGLAIFERGTHEQAFEHLRRLGPTPG